MTCLFMKVELLSNGLCGDGVYALCVSLAS